MPVKYALHPNPLTDNPKDHRAVIRHGDRFTITDIIDGMISRGSTVTKAEALSVIEEYEATIADLITEGGRLHTPLFRISLSVSGVFEGSEDRFDTNRHSLNVNIKPGPRVQELHKQITLQKTNGSKRRPEISNFTDVSTGVTNQKLTPGGVAMIRGRRLKTDPSDPEQGLFIMGSDGSEVRVDQIIRNMPKDLIITLPETLPPGPLRIEVRTHLRYTTEIRTGRLDALLQPA